MQRPKLLLTGFSVFPGAPVNPTEALVHELRPDTGDLDTGCDFRAEVLKVEYPTICDQLAAIARDFAPDIAIHFGLASEATGFRLERFGRNICDPARADNAGATPTGIVLAGGPAELESTLPREEIAERLIDAGLPATLDDQAGDYLCNAVFYLSRSGACGAFRPQMSGFVHVPQLAEADGGVPGEGARMALADLVAGARIAIRVCLEKWHEAAGIADGPEISAVN